MTQTAKSQEFIHALPTTSSRMADELVIAVSGAAGRMGRMICEVIDETKNASLGAALEKPGHEQIGKEVPGHDIKYQSAALAAGELASCTVMIAFTTADGVADVAACACEHSLALVVGTTGMSEPQQQMLADAQKTVPVLAEPNMSIGIHVLSLLATKAGSSLLPPQWDVEITESHHRGKVDTPSGTALRLGERVKQARGQDEKFIFDRSQNLEKRGSNEIGITASRLGDVVGEHSVAFAGPGEQIILTHRASSRRNFASGAVFAASKIAGQKPGAYTLAWALGSDGS